MTIDEQLRRAMADHAAAVPPPADRWAEVEARAAVARRAQARHRARRNAACLTVVGVAAAVAIVAALPALTRQPARRVVVTPAAHPTTAVTPKPPPTAHPPLTPQPAPATTGTGSSAAPSTTVASSGSGSLPLYPFQSLQQANAWQAAYKATGAQPWHLDPAQTSLSFAGFLGYQEITTVISVATDQSGAHVTVGFPNPNGGSFAAAVEHLRRFGTGAAAPWEVVGTDDTASFSVTRPRYGATVASPLTVGGAINGVDQSIRVEILQLSTSTPLGVFCCQPAGNSALPWTSSVTFPGATDKVLIVAASTGGGLTAVGQFSVTGVRTTPGTTPGL